MQQAMRVLPAAREAERAADWLLVRAGLSDADDARNEEDADAAAAA